MHTETERLARADITTRLRQTCCSDDGETSGAAVPSRTSDHRDVRLLLVVAADPEEPDAVAGGIAGERGPHGHHVAAVVCQAGDEDALQPPFQRQPELLPAAELLVDDGHRAGPERARPRQGAQPAAVVTDRALTSEHSVMCGSSCGFGCCVAGGVQCDRLAGAGGEGRGAVACRPAGSRSACPGQQERESNADLLEETGARLRIHICLVVQMFCV